MKSSDANYLIFSRLADSDSICGIDHGLFLVLTLLNLRPILIRHFQWESLYTRCCTDYPDAVLIEITTLKSRRVVLYLFRKSFFSRIFSPFKFDQLFGWDWCYLHRLHLLWISIRSLMRNLSNCCSISLSSKYNSFNDNTEFTASNIPLPS